MQAPVPTFAKLQRFKIMRNYKDAKAMARSLRTSLEAKSVELSHSDCLELIANAFEFRDWNVMAAKIDAEAGSATSAPVANGNALVFKHVIPILRIFDVEKAYEFYRDFLGFNVDWEHRFHVGAPLYAQVSRGNLKLHLSEHHGDASPGSTVFVWMRGIEAFHRELIGKAYKYNRPGLEDAEWDAKMVQVYDPFGNKVRFSEPHAADDPRA